MHTLRITSSLALAVVAAAAALSAAACGPGEGEGEGEGGTVVATTSQVGALAREVIGDEDVELHVLLAPGVNPHDYEPSAAEVARLGEAAVVLKNGVGLDDFLDDAISGAGAGRVVTVTEGIDLHPAVEGAHEEAGDEEHGGEFDPHVWHDPLRAKVMVQNITDALAETFPDHAEAFRANGAAYQARLDEVDAEIRAMFEGIPAEQRKVVTAHDSLGYFLERYDIKFVGAVIPSTASGAETSAQALAELLDLVRREGVRAIFAESSSDPRIAQQLAADAGIPVIVDLYGDTLGAPGTSGETLDGMLLHNAERIAGALR